MDKAAGHRGTDWILGIRTRKTFGAVNKTQNKVMQLDTLKSLREGAQIHLKAARQAAYGLDEPSVAFIRLQERKGYKIPFVVCRFSPHKPFGFFKPSDFGT